MDGIGGSQIDKQLLWLVEISAGLSFTHDSIRNWICQGTRRIRATLDDRQPYTRQNEDAAGGDLYGGRIRGYETRLGYGQALRY